MIREFQISDTQLVMQLWLAGNEDAHSFVAKEYWQANFEEVEKQLLKADIFVYDLNGEIKGFIGLMDEYIAGIFVDKAYRSQGIGRQLLEYVKQLHST
ncbi:MAG: GNAT family N-acetyltransferase, partial [Lactobacillus sp.]|nr:GNAT family N-acetyltransferase [Lactobacillus sp.]